MLVFFAPKNHDEHPHEAYRYMIGAMIPLGVLALVSGWFEGAFHHYVGHFLPLYDRMLDGGTHAFLILSASGMALGGIAYAVYKYRRGGFSPKWESHPIYRLWREQYYIPWLYEKLFMIPYGKLSRLAWKLDVKLIDFIVDLIARVIYQGGVSAKPIQSGNLSQMLRLMGAGVAILLGLMIFGLRG